MRRSFLRTTGLVSWSLLISTSVTFSDAPSTPDSILGPRVAEMFHVGYARGSPAFNQTQSQYQTLTQQSKNDPRLDHAYGLILLKLMKNKEAEEAFLAATKRPGAAYWPGWQALIWTNFTGKHYSAGFEHLLEFAELVESSDVTEIEKRSDAIDWIGQVMAALDLSLDAKKERENWIIVDTKLKELLGEEASKDYIRGMEGVHTHHSLLEDDIRESREKAKKHQEEQLEKKQTRIQKTLEVVKEKRENLKKTAEEMKSMFADHTTAYQNQMGRLERDFVFIERRSATLMSSMLNIDQETALLQQRKRNSNRTTANQIDLAIQQLQNQRMIYNAEFMRTSAVADEIAATARQLAQERAEFVDQYQKATGEIVAADEGAEKWKQRALNQEKALKKAKATAKPHVPTMKIQAAKTFRTYIELDLYGERNKLLASFGVTPLGK